MMTVVRALSAREPLWAAVTAVLPLVAGEDDIDAGVLRARYGEVFAAMGLSSDSDRDLALLTGAVETAKWVVVASEMAHVEPERFWQSYLARMQ